MEWLRWILLVFGAVLIGAIYVAGRREQRPVSEDSFPDRSFGVAGRNDPADSAQTHSSLEASAEPGQTEDDADVPEFGAAEAGAWVEHDFTIDPIAVEDAVDLDDPWTTRPEQGVPEPERRTPTGPELHQPEPMLQAEPEPELETEAEPEPWPASEPDAPELPESELGAERERVPDSDGEPADRRDHLQDEAIERAPRSVDPPTEKLVVLFLAAPEGERLVGAQLADAFARHGLEHGELGAFHARSRDGQRDAENRPATEFSIANVNEPGSFDPATMGTLSTPGVVLFLRIPGPPAPLAAFERMVVTARDLARELGGRVLDEKRTPLTRQSEQLLRDDLREFTARLAAKEGDR